MKLYPKKLFDTAAAWLINRLFKRKIKLTKQDYRKSEFSTSTQKMGLRFTERIRSYFRHKWIKNSEN